MELESSVIDQIESEDPEEDFGTAHDLLLQPRKAFRGLVRVQNGIGISLLLIYLTSVYSGLLPAMNSGETRTLEEIVFTALTSNGLGGIVLYAFFVAFTRVVSPWFGGTGSYGSTFRAYAWSSVPSLLGTTFTVLALAFFGTDIYQNVGNDVLLQWINYFFTYVGVALTLWQLVLLVIGVAEAQKVSIINSILILITPAVFFAAIFALAWLWREL